MTVTRGTGRPKGYHTDDGGRVPSVTTILNLFGDKGGMIHSAWKVGYDERKTLDETWYAQGTIGHQVHAMVEAVLHGNDPEQPTSLEALSAFEAWREWWEGAQFTVEATELPLVSERYRFGGTIDTVLRDSKGRLCIGDWKTSKAIYGNYLVQVAAYGLLWEEHSDEPLSGGYHIVQFSKEHGDFQHRHFRALDDERRLFLLLREAYDLNKSIEARAR